MRVGAIQSCYVPWRGYFDFINSVDLFVMLDDLQYPQGRSWRNRNRVKTSQGLRWLTVPVHSKGLPAIDEVEIAPSAKPWRATHQALLTEGLKETPHFDQALALWQQGVQEDSGRLSPLNMQLTRVICEFLGIETTIVQARP